MNQRNSPLLGTAKQPYGGFNSTDLRDANQELVKAFKTAKKAFETDSLKVRVTSTYRSEYIQMALYAQGRHPLEIVNKRRGLVQLPPITAEQNRQPVTHRKHGTSLHNLYPSKAIDIAIIKDGIYIANDIEPYRAFAALMGKANKTIKWGGLFPKLVDAGHFEL
jgi:peptidoglycan L-alanyl-D-glutamate endopeptidase CwlK